MRLVVIVLLLAGCGDKLTKPDPAAVEAMSYDAQCEAVAPRAARCANELLVADLQALGPDTAGLVDEMRRDDDLSADQARKIALHSCLGTLGERFPTRVLACWNEDDCTRFATCVTKR